VLLVLADVHANRHALEAVLKDAEGRYEQALFCGDAVGYGSAPNECIALLADLPLACSVRGNHDRAVTEGNGEDFSELAAEAVTWTVGRLGESERAWLEALPEGPLVHEPDLLVCHGHPVDEDLYILGWPLVRSALEAAPGALTLHGHTHLPAAWWESPGSPQGLTGGLPLQEEGLIPRGVPAAVNPGSVGQPRDGDPRASYLLLDPGERRLLWRRVSYDWEAAARDVIEAGLPSWLGERLREGR
jgi:predicted phosphodiesterase